MLPHNTNVPRGTPYISTCYDVLVPDLYRHFDAYGRLLYVGISISTLARLREHRRQSHWYERIARIEITKVATRELARKAELRAIRNEHPLWNIEGTGRRPPKGRKKRQVRTLSPSREHRVNEAYAELLTMLGNIETEVTP
jgi:hypothetical protein